MIRSGQQNEHHVMASACFTVLYRDSHVTKESMHVCLHFKGTHAIIKSWFLSKLCRNLQTSWKAETPGCRWRRILQSVWRVDIKLTSTLTNTFNEDSHKRSNDLTNSVTPDSNSTKRLVCGVLFTSNLDLDWKSVFKDKDCHFLTV